MAKQVRRKPSTPSTVRTPPARPRRQRAAQGQIERGVREIEKAIADVQRGLARAERRIETDARQRIRALQKEAGVQMRALRATHREATRLLGKLSAAAGGSWDDIVKMLETMVGEARTTASGVVERFRGVLD